jgi:hypothetical protein
LHADHRREVAGAAGKAARQRAGDHVAGDAAGVVGQHMRQRVIAHRRDRRSNDRRHACDRGAPQFGWLRASLCKGANRRRQGADDAAAHAGAMDAAGQADHEYRQ